VAIVLELVAADRHHEADKVRAGLSWWAFIRRSKSPELPVVLLEDVGRCSGWAARWWG
jgi:hypothetical protein